MKKAGEFVVLNETSLYTVELYVMGVLKEFHREKICKKLFKRCYNYSKDKGYLFMQVRTVKGCYKEYDGTITFYKNIGFK